MPLRALLLLWVNRQRGLFAVANACDDAQQLTVLVGNPHIGVRQLMVVHHFACLCKKGVAGLCAFDLPNIVLNAKCQLIVTVHNRSYGQVG